MPQPPEIDQLLEELLRLFRTAQDSLNEQLAQALTEPGTTRRRRRLRDLQRSVDAELRLLEENTAAWLKGAFPRVYELGGAQGAASIGESFSWSQPAVDAIQVLATDTFDDVLAATTHVRAEVQTWVRQEARRQTSLSLIEGRTAQQAARELARAAPREILEGLGGPVGLVRYADGSHRTFDDYSDMLLRTKTAVAFNAGTLETLGSVGVGWVEVLDGSACGWTNHEDGDKANGTIRSLREAQAHPLAHPRCRRSFIGRPDIESKDQARSARPSTTEAQRADQAAAEAERADRLARRRRNRANQGVRPPRQTRTTRQARTPRAQQPKATPIGPPAPTPSPTGVDPADVLSRIPSNSATHGRPVRDGLDAIRSVHRAPDGMERIPVQSTSSTRYNGQFSAQFPAPRGNGKPIKIELSRVQNPSPSTTFIHEFGHYLDHNGLGSLRDRFATLDPAEASLLSGWKTALEQSDAVRRLRGLPSDRYTRYLLDERELWARSYAQWIATRSGNQSMIAEIASRNTGSIATQWEPADFEPIADAFDRLFANLGLLL